MDRACARQGTINRLKTLTYVNTQFNPKRLLAETLLVVALAEISVMLILPVVATGLSTLNEGLLDITLLVLLAGPAVYWRFMAAFTSNAEPVPAARMGYGRSNYAIALTAITQLVGLLLTAAGVWWQSNNLDDVNQSRFNQNIERIETEVVRRLNQSVYGLKGARGAIAANPHFQRQEFRAYVESRDLPTEFPGIRGFGFIQHLPRQELDRFVATERAAGAPDFAVRTSGTASDLFVVRYVEPLAANRAALGFDLGQDPVRRRAVEYAMATGEPTLLAGIELLQDSRRSPGLLFLLPVYRKGSQPHTEAERERDLLGLLYAPIVARELLESVAAVTDNLVDFELFDGAQADPDKLIFDADGILTVSKPGQPAHHMARRYSADRTLNVGSRVLTLHSTSSGHFDATQDRSSLTLIGVGGTLVSFLMAISVWLLAVARQRARNLAEDMTAELDRMAQVVRHTENTVTIMDPEMRIQWVNQGFSRITGYSEEEARGKTPGELLSSGRSDPQAIQTLLDGAQRGVACRVELINRSRDGRYYWANTEVQPMLDKQGQLAGFMEIGTDISVQKETQHQLEAALRDGRALLDTVETHAIVSTTDAAGTITDVNDAFCRISGYSREELIGSNHRLLQSNTQDAAFWTTLWQTISDGRPWRGEICNQAKDGSLHWVDSMIAPFVGEDGRIEKYVSIRTDITARHQSADKLRQSEATFAAAFQDAATGMAMLSPEGQWLMANPALCDFVGLTQEQLHAMTFMDVSHPDERESDTEQMQRLLDGDIPVYQRAKRYLHHNGYSVWGLASVSVVRNEHGQPEFVIAQIVDITARKRAEEALGLSNALMEESQSVAKVGGWELNLVSGHLYWTRETYRIHETTPEDFNPTVDAGVDFYIGDSRTRISAALELAKTAGQGYDLELEILTTKGRRLDVRATCTATREQDTVVRLSGIFQDITERKQYERSLKEAREKAELATRSKGQFLANMSHEIRTPMNAILGMLRLLHNTELSSRQRDYADKTEDAAKSLLSLINDILDFSKVEAGKMQLDPQPFRVNRLMRSLSVILSSNLGPKSVEVLFDIDPSIPDVLLGDSMRLQQVLINLGGNAVKFTRQGQVVVSLRLRQLAGGCADIAFAVQDSGIGIAPEHQQHIFTGFSQAEASTTRKFGGTGLGLAISQRMVELMGGELHLTSTLGVGSTFAFTLRLPLVLQVPPALEEALPPSAELRRALVVDSNPVARELLSRMVQSWGWPTEVADSGEAALALVDARMQGDVFPFDVIYLDWHMSGMDGWATATQLHQMCTAAHAHQPVLVMVSGNSREALEQRTQEEQSLLSGFLVKPVTASMLLEAALESAASRARMRQSRRSSANQRHLDGMRILVVEDNLINQQVAEELLMSEGALVSLAGNGQLGVDAIAAAMAGPQFHAVLMDIQMPVMDGFAATQLVRGQLHLTKLPIIAMTANAMSSDREDCLAAGMNAHVGKPFDLKALVQTLLDITGYQTPTAAAEPRPSPAQVPALAAPVGLASPASVTGASVLDVAAALARMGGLTKLYLRSAKDFLQGLPDQLRALQSAAPEADAARCRLLAHSLKGTAALLGATDLSDIASHLEKQCKVGATAHLRVATLERLGLLAQVTSTQLQAAINQLESPGGAAPPVPPAVATAPGATGADRPALQRALGQLVPQLRADDLLALETFAVLRETLSTLPQALSAPLEEALQDLDLGRALSVCQSIQTWLDKSPYSPQQIPDT
jgi:PAS domain S-box-containing protein